MTSSTFERIGLGLYLLGLLLALWTVAPRYGAEVKHQATEIVLDAEALSRWQERLEDEGLAVRLLERGLSSLAFSELHLNDLVEEGLVVAQTAPEFALTLQSGGLGDIDTASLARLKAQPSSGTFLLFQTPKTSERLLPQLEILFGEDVEIFLSGRVVWLPHPKRTLQTVGLGFDGPRIERLRELGFAIWLRPENRPGLTAPQLSALFEEWARLPGVQGVIFGGGLNEAIGFPDLLEQTAQELDKLDWKLGYIELPPRAQQDGIETLVRALPDQTVRVMAVSPLHQAKLSPFRVLGMYSLGARERNIRVLYVRPYDVPGRPELDEEFLLSLPAELEEPGPAALFEPAATGPNAVVTAGLGVSAGALALLLLHGLGVKVRGAWWLLLAVAPLGGLAAAAAGKAVLFRSLLALAVGMGAPLYAFLKWVYPVVVEPPAEARLREGLRVLFLCTLLSLSAGLYLAALLSDTTFLLGLDRFRGVKLLTLGTPVLIVVSFLLKRYDRAQIAAGLKAYVAVYQALLAGLLALLLGLLYLRTGNDAGAAASEGERTLRVLLDRLLGVRPRFKEFMLAHPALVCLPLFASRTGFLPSLVLVLLAGIGQAGIVDTFAHVHTPLDVTAIRVGLGVLFGALVGLLAGSVGKMAAARTEAWIGGRSGAG